jgi:hypothetical protein
LAGKEKRPEELIDKNFEGKTVFSTRMMIQEGPPQVPMIGTGLFRVDNRTGELKCIYMLPPDTPTLAEGNEEEGSELVHTSAKISGVPLAYNN